MTTKARVLLTQLKIKVKKKILHIVPVPFNTTTCKVCWIFITCSTSIGLGLLPTAFLKIFIGHVILKTEVVDIRSVKIGVEYCRQMQNNPTLILQILFFSGMKSAFYIFNKNLEGDKK
jgi:hypothetical protein